MSRSIGGGGGGGGGMNSDGVNQSFFHPSGNSSPHHRGVNHDFIHQPQAPPVSHNFTPAGLNTGGQQIILDGDFLPATFRTQSYEIAKDTVRFVCRGECYGPAPSKAAVIMRSLVEDTIKDRAQMMCQLVKTLDVQEREQLGLVRNIANNMFDDEQVNWSRIVTLHAFCGCLAKYCEQRHLPDCADDVANVLADFVVNRLGLWIVTHGGWKEFERHFPALVLWGPAGLWKGLVIVVLLFGTMFAFYSSIQFYGNAIPQGIAIPQGV